MDKDLHIGIVVHGTQAQLSLGGPSSFIAGEVEAALNKLHAQLGSDLPPVYEVHVICRRALCELTENGENEDHRFDSPTPHTVCRCGKYELKPSPTEDAPDRLMLTPVTIN